MARLRGESVPSVRATACRETSDWTMADRMNPSARGQKISQNMPKEAARAWAIAGRIRVTTANYSLAQPPWSATG